MRNKLFWKFFVLTFFFVGVESICSHMTTTLPKYMTREFGADTLYGTMLMINPVLILLLVPLFAPLSLYVNSYT